jgi:hypothetical protein
MSKTPQTKQKRNLRALFILAFLLVIFTSAAGGLILYLGYPHPGVTQPLWEFGQWMLFFGLVNLLIYLGIFFQTRTLRKVPDETDVAVGLK